MHALAICCLLLAAVYVAPTAATIDIDVIEPPTHRKSGKTDRKFKELLKELGKYLLDRAKEFGIGKYNRLAEAIIGYTLERDFASFVLEFFDGEARELLNEFDHLLSGIESEANNDMGKFFKSRWTAIVSQFLNVLGGEGDDLLSTSTSLMEAITTRLLQLVEELNEHEAAALAHFSASIVKEIVRMATSHQRPLHASIHILIDGAIPLVKEFLLRLLKMRDTLIDYERQPYNS